MILSSIIISRWSGARARGQVTLQNSYLLLFKSLDNILTYFAYPHIGTYALYNFLDLPFFLS